MKNMKKFLALFSAIAITLTASGCSAAPGFLSEAFNAAMDADFAAGAETPPPTGGAEYDYGTDYGIIGDTDECINDGYENPVKPQAGLLTGGEWKDNAHWSDWNALYTSHKEWNSFKAYWRIKWDSRIAISVTADGKPAQNAKVSCEDALFSSVTDNNGKAYLFYDSKKGIENPITVRYNGETKTITQLPESGEITVEFGSATADEKSLDLMIVCDTTGSMSDELEYLKTELSDIIKRIKNQNANLPTRVSVNFYRDEGDDYVVRPFDFTTDINEVVRRISQQSADGGGDYPEALHSALGNAVADHDWNEFAVKIMFLVLDAPAHDDPQIIDSMNKYIATAAEMGIRIIPVASSGVDKSTEYLLRTIAIRTGGTYTFLTNDSGIGGDHIEATVGAYNIEKLGDMMVRIVGEYLS